jgi:hypothetical protein
MITKYAIYRIHLAKLGVTEHAVYPFVFVKGGFLSEQEAKNQLPAMMQKHKEEGTQKMPWVILPYYLSSEALA